MADIGLGGLQKAGIIDSYVGQLGRRRRYLRARFSRVSRSIRVADVLAPFDVPVQRRNAPGSVIGEYRRAA